MIPIPIPIPIPGIFTCYVPGIGTIPRLDLISVSSFLVFRKMSFTIHLNFSPLAGIIIFPKNGPHHTIPIPYRYLPIPIPIPDYDHTDTDTAKIIPIPIPIPGIGIGMIPIPIPIPGISGTLVKYDVGLVACSSWCLSNKQVFLSSHPQL